MNLIDHDIIIKIAESQKKKMSEAQNKADSEIAYLKQAFQRAVTEQLGELIANPFNTYIKVPWFNYDPQDKLFLELFKKQYNSTFNHDVQCGDGKVFLILIKSQHFVSQVDCRPTTLEVQKADIESPEDEAPFTQNEMKRFADREMSCANSSTKVAPFKKTPLSSRREQPRLSVESQLIPMFLQRRLSKTIPPSLDSSREPSVNS
jgi:hypothetical protein